MSVLTVSISSGPTMEGDVFRKKGSNLKPGRILQRCDFAIFMIMTEQKLDLCLLAHWHRFVEILCIRLYFLPLMLRFSALSLHLPSTSYFQQLRGEGGEEVRERACFDARASVEVVREL